MYLLMCANAVLLAIVETTKLLKFTIVHTNVSYLFSLQENGI